MSSPAAKCPELARQQKRRANARHRARKKAQQAEIEWALTATAAELDRERGRTAELLHEQEALHKMSAYQQEAAQLLDFAALAEQVEGELTLYPTSGGAHPNQECDGALGALGAALTALTNGGDPQAVQAMLEDDNQAAIPMPRSGFVTTIFEAALSSFGGSSGGMRRSAAAEAAAAFSSSSGLAQGAAPGAAAAAAAAAEDVDLDAVLAELADADLSLLRHQAQGGSGEDWLDALLFDDPVQKPQPPAPLQHAPQPQQQAHVVRAQSKPAGAKAIDLRMFMGGTWLFDHYPLQPPPWLLRLATRAIRLVPVSLLERNTRRFIEHLQESLQRWEACPGSRRDIEHLIAARMADRHYCMQQLAEYRPADLLTLFSKFACPPPPAGSTFPDGRPLMHSALLPAAQYLEATLSDRQLVHLHEAWLRFHQASQAAQQRRAYSTASLHHAAAQQCVSWQKQSTLPHGGCTAERAEAFSSIADGTGGLAAETQDLAMRLLQLQGALLRVLSPLQMARLLLAAKPYFADLVQIEPWLFAGVAASAATRQGCAPVQPSVASSGVWRGPASGGSAGTESGSAEDDASSMPLPVGFADVLLEERLQALEGTTKSSKQSAPANGNLGGASCGGSGGSGHDPAHLLATAASLSMPGW